MENISKFIKGLNFRHVFATMILITYVIITTLPFWIGSKGLDAQAWTYLTASQGAITVLLTLAGRRYFDKADIKEEIKPINNDNYNVTNTGISYCKFSSGQDTASLPQ